MTRRASTNTVRLLLLVSLLVGLFLAHCGPKATEELSTEPSPTEPPPTEPPPTRTPVPPPEPGECEVIQELRGVTIPNDPPFLFPEQVIVTGPLSQVSEMLAGSGLVTNTVCTLNYQGDTPDRDNPVVMNLYTKPGADWWQLLRVVQDINDGAQRLGYADLSADPNLLVGASASVCGNPHASGGSPFGPPKPLDVEWGIATELFWEQWAFEHINIGAATEYSGTGVIVGVFDTSPFPKPSSDADELMTENLEKVTWVNSNSDTETLRLNTLYPKPVFDLPPAGKAYDVRDHGLFVAGLVHAVAPGSELYLIRVLDEYGCGNLFTLNIALDHFTGEVVKTAKEKLQPFHGVVINLSLGIHPTDEHTALDEYQLNILEEYDLDYDINILNIESPRKVLSDAHNRGMVIVAAAGNDSPSPDTSNNLLPLPPQIPAAYRFVLGVEATNQGGERACFSNLGDIRAPGGEGGQVGGDPCASLAEYCPDDDGNYDGTYEDEDCSNAVISLVLSERKVNDADWPTHYAYWSGTSFSAPLVSGLAALATQCGASLAPSGVINVADTLNNCPP